jgi:multiple sugar transport system permease protein
MFEQLRHLPKLPAFGSYRKMSKMARREMWTGLAFLSPWIVGFMFFTLIPLVATFVFSFANLKVTDGILNPIKFVGLDNYAQYFKDPQIWSSTKGNPGAWMITLKYGIIALPIGIIVPLALALLLNNRYLKGSVIARTLFYMPSIVPLVAGVIIWNGMLNAETGWINRFLLSIGIPKPYVPGWLASTTWVYPGYVIIGLWGLGGAMLISLAGLQGVPTELYDAAKVDGANGWQAFFHVTFPMISPVIFYNLILGMVGLFQYYLIPFVLNNGNGAPGGTTMFYNVYLVRTFLTFMNMSYGSTMAIGLFVAILLATLLLFWSSKFWVYYAADSR